MLDVVGRYILDSKGNFKEFEILDDKHEIICFSGATGFSVYIDNQPFYTIQFYKTVREKTKNIEMFETVPDMHEDACWELKCTTINMHLKDLSLIELIQQLKLLIHTHYDKLPRVAI